MIPDFDPTTGALPPGVHSATMAELQTRFGTNSRRQALLVGLRRAAENLRAAGCRTLYVDGSFVTQRDIPGDFDGCWDPAGVNPDLVDPILLDFRFERLAQKTKYGGELFLSTMIADKWGHPYLDFFQVAKDGSVKGIIALDLTRL